MSIGSVYNGKNDVYEYKHSDMGIKTSALLLFSPSTISLNTSPSP